MNNKMLTYTLLLVTASLSSFYHHHVTHVQAIEPFSVVNLNRIQKQQEQQGRNTDTTITNKFVYDTISSTSAGNDEELLYNDIQELYVEQRLDHFASFSTDSSQSDGNRFPFSFQQRYFYTSRFVHTEQLKTSEEEHKHDEHEPELEHEHEHEQDIQAAIAKSSNSVTSPLRSLLRHGQNLHSTESQHTTTTSTSSSNTLQERETYVFLCVGGEGPSLDKSVLLNSVHCTGDMIQLALILHQERGANVHLFALEHRYYGNSYPTFFNNNSNDSESPVTNTNLQFLSSRQALADLASFVTFANAHYNITQPTTTNDKSSSKHHHHHVKWVTFGGSYPGMLAAWARLKYPHLINAAVSNSAPIQPTLIFANYKNKVSQDLKNTKIGGSDYCLNQIQTGHEDIARHIENGDYQLVADLFELCDGEDSLTENVKNVKSFLGDGVIYIPAQENDPSCEGDLCNIEKICNYITTSTEPPMETLAQISRIQTNSNATQSLLSSLSTTTPSSSPSLPPPCKDISWSKMLNFLISPTQSQIDGTRSWLWQTCTEFGFYQTCEFNSTCPFQHGYHTIELDLEICEKAFGISPLAVKENIRETLLYYGGWDMKGSRILSVNGDVDPWSTLSMNQKRQLVDNDDDTDSYDDAYYIIDSDDDGFAKEEMPTVWSMGASHHFWTHEIKPSDGEEIIRVRKFIYDWVISTLLDSQI